MRKVGIIFFLLTVVSCNQSRVATKGVSLSPVLEIDQFSDSTFFSDIRSMYAYQDRVYVSDYTRSQVMVLNNNGILISTVSSQGQGPGELIGPSSLFVHDDTLYVYDDKRKISVFYKDKYLRSFDVPTGLGGTRFGLSGKHVIVANLEHPNSLAIVDTHTDSIVHFGQMFDFRSIERNRLRNGRFVLIQDSFVYAVSDNQPIVEKYSLQGNFIDSYDYSDVKIVNEKLSYVQRMPEEEKSYYILVNDCYLQNNKLYLLLVTRKEDRMQSNIVLEMDITRTMQVDKIYNLGEGWFKSICGMSDCLWAFNRTKATLVKYKIP